MGETGLFVLFLLRPSLDVRVWQHHWPNLEVAVIQISVEGEEVQHMVAEASNRTLLDRDQHVVLSCQPADELRVYRLHPPRIRHRHPDSGVAHCECASGDDRGRQPSAQAQDGHALSRANMRLHDDAPLAYRERLRLFWQLLHVIAKKVVQLLNAERRAAGVPQRRRHVVDLVYGLHHIPQLQLVRRRADNKVGDAAKVGQIETAVMRGPIIANKTSAIEDESDGQLLDGAVVHHLVVGALQESRVDGAERLNPLDGETGGESHRVLLCDAHVKSSLWVAAAELIDASAARHRRCDRHNAPVGCGNVDERVGKHSSV
mmetsp:Transcript_48411/g.112141  ORF Transcript_48411/g.112141 Transcript_48411/m.112141 type:complete len:317 (-) Transcript_48411:1167-2117(-)